MKSKRSKACDISEKVKQAVYERDNGLCVITSRPGLPNAHFIPRSDGGLGIEENVITLAPDIHAAYDNGYHKDINLREYYGGLIEEYLKSKYPNWDKSKLYYSRWENVK